MSDADRPEDAEWVMKRRQTGTEALTLIELMIIIAVLAVVAILFLPLFFRPHGGMRLNCANNQRQIGVAFKTWSLDNNGRLPMQVPATNGGTMEAVGSGIAFVHFQAISNELNTPKILFCPEENDPARAVATVFSIHTQGSWQGWIPFTNDLNLSYFVGVDADPTRPQMPLAGDRNLATNGVPLRHGLHTFSTNASLSWVKPRPRHNGGGYIGLVDGSVQGFNASALKGVLAGSGAATNRLAFP